MVERAIDRDMDAISSLAINLSDAGSLCISDSVSV